MARPKKYNISLTDDELKELKSVMRKKQTTKTVRNRCQIIIDLILSILVYTLFSRMFDLMQPPVVKHSIAVA